MFFFIRVHNKVETLNYSKQNCNILTMLFEFNKILIII